MNPYFVRPVFFFLFRRLQALGGSGAAPVTQRSWPLYPACCHINSWNWVQRRVFFPLVFLHYSPTLQGSSHLYLFIVAAAPAKSGTLRTGGGTDDTLRDTFTAGMEEGEGLLCKHPPPAASVSSLTHPSFLLLSHSGQWDLIFLSEYLHGLGPGDDGVGNAYERGRSSRPDT